MLGCAGDDRQSNFRFTLEADKGAGAARILRFDKLRFQPFAIQDGDFPVVYFNKALRLEPR